MIWLLVGDNVNSQWEWCWWFACWDRLILEISFTKDIEYKYRYRYEYRYIDIDIYIFIYIYIYIYIYINTDMGTYIGRPILFSVSYLPL
jgi:hypothetical protein